MVRNLQTVAGLCVIVHAKTSHVFNKLVPFLVAVEDTPSHAMHYLTAVPLMIVFGRHAWIPLDAKSSHIFDENMRLPRNFSGTLLQTVADFLKFCICIHCFWLNIFVKSMAPQGEQISTTMGKSSEFGGCFLETSVSCFCSSSSQNVVSLSPDWNRLTDFY